LRFQFDPDTLRTLVSGVSAIDHKKLDIQDLVSAHKFVLSYGFDLNRAEDLEEIWFYHRKAISILREHLLEEGENIPENLADPTKLQDFGNLLILASGTSENQKWACAILRVMHVYAHLQNDIYSQFSDEIQNQVLRRFKEFIVEDPIV